MLRRFFLTAALWVAAGLVLGILPAAWPGPTAANAFRAGAARVDITPKVEMLTPTLGGIHDPLFARAIVIDNGEARAAIVAADHVVLTYALCRAASARVAREAGVPAENLILAATHDHETPFPPGLGGPA